MAEPQKELVVLMTKGADHEPSSVAFTIANGGITAGLEDLKSRLARVRWPDALRAWACMRPSPCRVTVWPERVDHVLIVTKQQIWQTRIRMTT
jgi:hypothetical protein